MLGCNNGRVVHTHAPQQLHAELHHTACRRCDPIRPDPLSTGRLRDRAVALIVKHAGNYAAEGQKTKWIVDLVTKVVLEGKAAEDEQGARMVSRRPGDGGWVFENGVRACGRRAACALVCAHACRHVRACDSLAHAG